MSSSPRFRLVLAIFVTTTLAGWLLSRSPDASAVGKDEAVDFTVVRAETPGQTGARPPAESAASPSSVQADAVRSLITTDPAEAATLACGLESEEDRIDVLELAVFAWVQRDPAGARRWIMAERNEPLRDRLIGSGARALAATDACTALEWAVGSIQSDELLANVTLAIVDTWAGQHPAQAASLVDQLPEGGLREQAADRVARHWLRTNPTIAYIWMKGAAESEHLLAQLAEHP